MANSISLVGLDVHAAQTHAAVLDLSTGELHRRRLNCPPGSSPIVERFYSFDPKVSYDVLGLAVDASVASGKSCCSATGASSDGCVWRSSSSSASRSASVGCRLASRR
jgi:hypothetical protein